MADLSHPSTRPLGSPVGVEPAARSGTPRRSRTAARAIAGLIVLLALVSVVTFTSLYLLGFRAQGVLSGSMQPTLGVGDLVVSRPAQASALRPGDLVTFSADGSLGATITHRVISISQSRAGLEIETKGDANSGSEQWLAPMGSQVGVTWFHTPYLGRVLVGLGQTWVRIGLAVLVLIYLLLSRIWRGAVPVGGPRQAGSGPRAVGAVSVGSRHRATRQACWPASGARRRTA